MTRKNLYKIIKDKPTTQDEILDIYELNENQLSKAKSLYDLDVINYVRDMRVSDNVIKGNLKSIYNTYEILHTSVNSLLKKLNFIRTEIKKLRSSDLYRISTYSEYFNIPKEERKRRNEAYKKVNSDRNNSPVKIDLNDVNKKMNELLNETHRYSLGSGLLIASGLRPVELMCISTFKLDDDNKNNVIITGLAKKRRGMANSVSRPIVGISPEDFIEKVKLFRNSVDNPCKKSEKIARGLQRAFKAKFPVMAKMGRFLFSRKIYSELAFQKYAPPELRTNKPLYLSQILGHKNGDVQTSQAYSWIMS